MGKASNNQKKEENKKGNLDGRNRPKSRGKKGEGVRIGKSILDGPEKLRGEKRNEFNPDWKKCPTRGGEGDGGQKSRKGITCWTQLKCRNRIIRAETGLLVRRRRWKITKT